MIHRTARERLLFEAREAAEDVESLEGLRGHTAALERSAHGPARMVRVSHEGAVVSWSFSLEPGEARPDFYPEDVPQIPDAHCDMTWDDETGLVVKWREQLDPQRQAQFRQNLESFRERVEELKDQAMKSAAGLTPEQKMEALLAMASPALEEDVESRMGRIVAFHEAAGWSLESEAGSGPVMKAKLKRGDTERSVIATNVGASVIVLSEEMPGSEGSHYDGPTEPRVGLRLKMG